MNSIKSGIPRAIFYMNPWEPLRSAFQVLTGSAWKKSGQSVQQFEKKISEIFPGSQAKTVSHARIGLFTILDFLKIPQGSEVLMTPVNLPEMLMMLKINGLTPTYIGFKKNSFEPDLDSAKITSKTKVFFYTPLAGIIQNQIQIVDFCERHELILIQDLTQSFAGQFNEKPLTDFTPYNFFSLCDFKVIHTHRGGLIVTSNLALADFIEKQKKNGWFTTPSQKYFLKFILEDMIAGFILNRAFFHWLVKPLVKLFSKSKADIIENITAGNGLQIGGSKWGTWFMSSGNSWQESEIPSEIKYSYTDLQASLGLRRLLQWKCIESARIKNSELAISKLTEDAKAFLPNYPTGQKHLYWKFPILVKDTRSAQKFFLQRNIDCARSNLPWLPNILNPRNQFVAGQEMKDQVLYLPLHWYLSSEEILGIAKALNEFAEINRTLA